MTVVITALAGSAGALARYLLSGSIHSRVRSQWPVGTAAVNLIGSLGLGFVLALDVPDANLTVGLAGFLAGFTTFSTWMIETMSLGVLPRPTRRATGNLIGVAALGVGFAALGYSLGRLM